MECNKKPACKKCGLVLKNESLELHLLKECDQSLFNCSRCDEVFYFNNFDELKQK
jgi:hypothetical protein